MNFFAVLLLFWFISVKSTNATGDGTFHKNANISVKSSTARAQDETFHENAKTNVNSSTGTQDGKFYENAKKNGNAGLNVVLRNDAKQAGQLTRPRRSVSNIFNTAVCYRHFFVAGKPPTGFKTVNVRYICQGACTQFGQTSCFSTLYDLTYKVPLYSAYVLRPLEWKSIGKFKRGGYNWRKESGLDLTIKDINKNIDSMYSNTRYLPCIHKGHLVPAETYSFSEENIESTFVYTNAVPQYEKFNSGKWSVYEDRIRTYGKSTCAAKKGGNLYLLTGISDIRITGVTKTTIDYDKFKAKRMPEEPNIVIPNSMWTAGCCVKDKKVRGAFAVIGNNDPVKEYIYMTPVTVQSLENILGKGVNLFPGNDGCKDNKYDVHI